MFIVCEFITRESFGEMNFSSEEPQCRQLERKSPVHCKKKSKLSLEDKEEAKDCISPSFSQVPMAAELGFNHCKFFLKAMKERVASSTCVRTEFLN